LPSPAAPIHPHSSAAAWLAPARRRVFVCLAPARRRVFVCASPRQDAACLCASPRQDAACLCASPRQDAACLCASPRQDAACLCVPRPGKTPRVCVPRPGKTPRVCRVFVCVLPVVPCSCFACRLVFTTCLRCWAGWLRLGDSCDRSVIRMLFCARNTPTALLAALPGVDDILAMLGRMAHAWASCDRSRGATPPRCSAPPHVR